MSSPTSSESFDVLDPALLVDVHGEPAVFAAIAEQRATCPVGRVAEVEGDHPAYWSLTRYDDVKAVAQNWRTFPSGKGIAFVFGESPNPMPPIESDPPEQGMWRRLLNPALTPAAVESYTVGMEDTANRLIDEFASKGRCESVSQFAQKLPGTVLFEVLLGLDAELLQEAQRLSDIVVFSPESPDFLDAMLGLADICTKLIMGEIGSGDRPIVEALRQETFEGVDLPIEARVSCLIVLLLGGLDTTMSLIGSAIRHLALHPDLRDHLVANPDRLGDAMEEYLRLYSPVVGLTRMTEETTVVGGVEIPRGERVLATYAAANRDPAYFENPDQFDLDREFNAHLAFGAGVHRCMGSNLARKEATVAMRVLLERLPDFAPAPDQPPTEYALRTGWYGRNFEIVFTPS